MAKRSDNKRRRKNFRILESLLGSAAAFCCFFLLSSCAGAVPSLTQSGEELRFGAADMQNFAVVRSDSASDLVVKEALRIRQTVEEATGTAVELKTDWERGGSGKSESGSDGEEPFEILVGMSSREECLAVQGELSQGDFFLIRSVGRKILIVSTSETILSDAVDYFLDTCLTVDPEKGEVVIRNGIDYRSESYAFFSVARGGEADCDFVVPDTAGKELTAAVDYVAKRMGEDYGCTFRIRRESELTGEESGLILVGRLSLPLCQEVYARLEEEEGTVRCLEDQVVVAGSDDRQVIAALGEFYASLKQTPDTDCAAGLPYARYETTKVIDSRWSYDLPYPMGASKTAEENLATACWSVTFSGADAETVKHFYTLLQERGLALHVAGGAEGEETFVAIGSVLTVRIQFRKTAQSLTLSIEKTA